MLRRSSLFSELTSYITSKGILPISPKYLQLGLEFLLVAELLPLLLEDILHLLQSADIVPHLPHLLLQLYPHLLLLPGQSRPLLNISSSKQLSLPGHLFPGFLFRLFQVYIDLRLHFFHPLVVHLLLAYVDMLKSFVFCLLLADLFVKRAHHLQIWVNFSSADHLFIFPQELVHSSILKLFVEHYNLILAEIPPLEKKTTSLPG